MQVQHDQLQRQYRERIRQRLQSKLSALAMKKSAVAQSIIDDCRQDAFLASPTTRSFEKESSSRPPSLEAGQEAGPTPSSINEKSEATRSSGALVMIAILQMVVIVLLVWYLIKFR